ncbi:MAG: hypothetical protein NTZ44_01285 [Candidatus Nomurabacteria bacterium]|nr:hypothetical protein [Candidatus Nomurabacteria bacterium]
MSPEGQIVPSEKVPTSKMWKSATKGKNPKVPFEVDDNQRKLALIASKKEIVNPKRKL